jgi:hypothetical protein
MLVPHPIQHLLQRLQFRARQQLACEGPVHGLGAGPVSNWVKALIITQVVLPHQVATVQKPFAWNKFSKTRRGLAQAMRDHWVKRLCSSSIGRLGWACLTRLTGLTRLTRMTRLTSSRWHSPPKLHIFLCRLALRALYRHLGLELFSQILEMLGVVLHGLNCVQQLFLVSFLQSIPRVVHFRIQFSSQNLGNYPPLLLLRQLRKRGRHNCCGPRLFLGLVPLRRQIHLVRDLLQHFLRHDTKKQPMTHQGGSWSSRFQAHETSGGNGNGSRDSQVLVGHQRLLEDSPDRRSAGSQAPDVLESRPA